MFTEQYLFHLTHKNRIDSILENGLIPYRGHHCKVIRDKTPPAVFMCREWDIGFWYRCFRDVDIVLKIYVEPYKDKIKIRKSSFYTEYGMFDVIEPVYISIFETDMKKYKNKTE